MRPADRRLPWCVVGSGERIVDFHTAPTNADIARWILEIQLALGHGQGIQGVRVTMQMPFKARGAGAAAEVAGTSPTLPPIDTCGDFVDAPQCGVCAVVRSDDAEESPYPQVVLLSL